MYDGIYGLIDDWVKYGDLDAHGQFTFRGHHGPEMDGNFRTLFSLEFQDLWQQLCQEVSRTYTLKMKVQVTDTIDAELLGKKLLFYSDQAIVEVVETRRSPEPYELVNLLVQLRPAVEAGRLIILPEKFDDYAGYVHLANLDFGGYAVELEHSVTQRFGLTQHKAATPSLEVRLPHLHHIPLPELVAFREHNAVNFETFHRHLRALITKLESAAEHGEVRAIIDLVDEVDYETRRLDDLYRDARRKSLVLSAYDLAYVAGGLILYGALPDSVYQIVAATIGGAKIKSVVDRLTSQPTNRDNPFYVAWKLHHKFGSTSR